MKAMNKSVFLDELAARVERQLDISIRTLQNLTEKELIKRSDNNGWSMAECLDHLNSYGNFYLPEIKKTLQRKGRSDTYKSSWIGDKFASMMEPGSSRKYNAFKDHLPSENLDAHQVTAEFIRQLEILLAYLEEARNSDLDAKVPISISKLIRLKLGDVFRFLVAHNDRHLQQGLRNL